MTLLITVIAAIVSVLIWYNNDKRKEYNLGFLVLMFSGASIMWFVDAVVEYMELGPAYFTPAAADVANDAFLGLTVVVAGLLIWLVTFLIRDPKGVIRVK